MCTRPIHDVDRIAPLFDAYRQFYGRAADLDVARRFLTERLQHAESVVLYAQQDASIVGFTQLFPSFSSTRAARTYILNDLFVVPEARRLGVATQLLNETLRYCRALGAARVSLSTALSNEPARKLYESLGWKQDTAFCEYNFSL